MANIPEKQAKTINLGCFMVWVNKITKELNLDQSKQRLI